MTSLMQIAFIIIGSILVAINITQASRHKRLGNLVYYVLAGIALFSIVFTLFVWLNHLYFPLNLDLMESTILQHVGQLTNGKPVYPEPSPEYVPLAYNVLYYVISIPFASVLGLSLPTLRFVAILASIGATIIMFDVVRRYTQSIWWSLITVGLFAAAYYVMDTYLDNAHSDSWFLFMALLGSYILDRAKSRTVNIIGILVLVASFWFKQHGALFTIGGVLYLTLREGILRSIPYWLTAGIFGPIAYVLAGPVLFGPRFIYFTWEVPRGWSSMDLSAFTRLARFIATTYPFMAVSAGLLIGWKFIQERRKISIWFLQAVMAVLTGLMGSLDAGSADNVYISMGVWFILAGTLGLFELERRSQFVSCYRLHLVILLASFALLLYDPRNVLVSPQAHEAYIDFITMLDDLDGQVYAPTLGQLQGDYQFYPAAHWVALEDMIRGPGRETRDHPNTRQFLEPLIYPEGRPAYILTNNPLESEGNFILGFLLEDYVLDIDFGNRFEPLRVLPKRFDHLWPRYLYRYDPEQAATE
ncbi:MAG: hypothetical protein H6671_03705 [Anaerolineaceae bacterium]|nr:hypothetical protein [Anaerolineaceae bacterium]